MNITIGPLDAFYIAGAIALLAVAVIAYPTLREKSEAKRKIAKQK